MSKYAMLVILLLLPVHVLAIPPASYLDSASSNFDYFTAPHWPAGITTVSLSGAYTQADEQILHNIIDDFNYYCIPVDLQYHPFGGNPDIKIMMLPQAQISKMYGRESVAGYASFTYNAQNEIVGAICFVSNDRPIYERSIMYHELLHAMGCMYHSANTDSVLWPYCKNGNLTANDIEAIQCIYPFWLCPEFQPQY